jgi:hypothetical protein
VQRLILKIQRCNQHLLTLEQIRPACTEIVHSLAEPQNLRQP